MTPRPEAVGIAILARAPVAGATKTRLIPALGAEGAARLHRRLLQRTVAAALAARLGPVTLWWAGGAPRAELPGLGAADAPRIAVQPPGDLGDRMLAAVNAGLPRPTLVIGSDCPGYTAELLREAAAALAHHDAVLVPAEDGGYVLIGLAVAEPRVFAGMAWGSAGVLTATRARLRALGWNWRELAPLWDVDRPADLARLATEFPDLLIEAAERPGR